MGCINKRGPLCAALTTSEPSIWKGADSGAQGIFSRGPTCPISIRMEEPHSKHRDVLTMQALPAEGCKEAQRMHAYQLQSNCLPSCQTTLTKEGLLDLVFR